MKNIAKAIYVLLFVLFIVSSCNTHHNNPSHGDITFLLDSLKSIYAPDQRVSLWNVTITNTTDTTRIIGDVDDVRAYHAIIEVIETKYPSVLNRIKLLPEKESKQTITGLINNSVANLRSKPRHSAEIATQALLGTPIKILKKENGWYLVQTPNKYIAWVDAAGLVKLDLDDLKHYKESEKIIYNKMYGFAYSKPDCNSQTVSDLAMGCILHAISSNEDFYEVQYPDKRIGWVKKDEVTDAEKIFNKRIIEKELVKTSKKFLGIPYLWGGTSSKAIDCSGFSSTIYFMNGVVLQRDASQQIKYGKKISDALGNKNLEPGDLLFFGRKASDSLPEKVTHVAMYLDDTEFIHASGKVRINSVDSTRDNYAIDYMDYFLGARRIKGAIDGVGIERISENNFYKEIIRNNK